MSVLIIGFQPWGSHRRNPSGEIASALGGHVLPVDYAAAGRELGRLIRRRPRAILMFGLAGDRRRISVEAVALNVDYCSAPRRRTGPRRIRPGPLALAARVPLDRIVNRLRRARIPTERSHHAGTFVCNHVFYLALASTRVPCGFVHVPPTRVISLKRQLRAARMILGEVNPLQINVR